MNKMILELISAYIGFSPEVTMQLSRNAHKTYRTYLIPKKKGGNRLIFHPSKYTKSLQYAFIETILNQLPVHPYAAAYIRGLKSPLLANAAKHSCYSYTVRIDIKDFFPSIRPTDLINVLHQTTTFNEINSHDQDFLTRSLFVKYRDGKLGLAIGAPSSPVISNIVMFHLDEKICELAMSISSDSIYTRYADDIVFSSNKKGACKDFHDGIKKILKDNASPKLIINKTKTVFTSRGTKRVITGLHICPDGLISIGRKNKRYIKKLLHNCIINKIDSAEKKYLSGYLSFILDVEPDFYNRLALKYGAMLVSQAHKNRM